MITQELIDKNKVWNDSLIITPQEFLKHNPLFESFFKNVNRWNNKIICLANKNNKNDYSLVFYTKEREYELTVRENYIGLTSSCRRELPFETWHRMSDLNDGSPTIGTLMGMLQDILSVELETIEVENYKHI